MANILDRSPERNRKLTEAQQRLGLVSSAQLCLDVGVSRYFLNSAGQILNQPGLPLHIIQLEGQEALPVLPESTSHSAAGLATATEVQGGREAVQDGDISLTEDPLRGQQAYAEELTQAIASAPEVDRQLATVRPIFGSRRHGQVAVQAVVDNGVQAA